MTESSPLPAAQQKFIDALSGRLESTETIPLEEALGRTLHNALNAPEDSPSYHRAIAEGFVVQSAETQEASEERPVRFTITAEVEPGDATWPALPPGGGIRVATGSLVADGPLAIVRMWEASCDDKKSFTITRPFPPRFFIEDRGCTIQAGDTIIAAGSKIDAEALGTLASLGIDSVEVTCQPRVTLFSSGDEVIPYTATPQPGQIRDCNRIMLSAAVRESGATATFGGIMGDDFDAFVAATRAALERSEMILISGGTAVGGRDFISDLISEVGELIIDGVPMRSGRPLIMGIANGKPIVAVAGHPPEALRGFHLFGRAAIDKLLGSKNELPGE